MASNLPPLIRDPFPSGQHDSHVDSRSPAPVVSQQDLLLLVSLILFESSIATLAMALYMKGERFLGTFLSSRPGIAALCAAGILIVSGTVIVRRCLANMRSSSSHFRLIVTMNFVTVLLILITGEAVVRVSARQSLEGETLLGKALVPKNWSGVALRNRQLLNEAGARLTYLIYDDRLGWTVGPNRRSANGLYYSSSEGLRAPPRVSRSPRSLRGRALL